MGQPRARSIPSADIPQAATRLGRIRAAVGALARGSATAELVAARGGMAHRHALYQLAAARALGWASRAGSRRHAITARGAALLGAEPGSEEERTIFVAAVRGSALVAALSAGVDARAPDAEQQIAARAMRLSDPPLAPETARERARTIASWLRQAASPQRALAFDR